MNVLFGTYHCPPHEPESFGLREPMRQSYLAQLIHPFRRRREKSVEPDPDPTATGRQA